MNDAASNSGELLPPPEVLSPPALIGLRTGVALGAYLVGVGLIYLLSALGAQFGQPWLGVVGLAIDVVALGAYIGWLGYRHDPLAGTLGPLFALLLLVLVFSVADIVQNGDRYSFWTTFNMRIVAIQTIIVTMGALGMTVIIIAGGIDLSAGVTVALCATVLAWWLDDGMKWATAHDIAPHWVVAIAILACLGTGMSAGAVNGSLIAGLGVAPFIVTLGTMMAMLGLAKIVAEETTIRPALSAVPSWMSAMVKPQPDPAWLTPPYLPWFPQMFPNFGWGVWLTAGLAVVMALVLEFTVFGRHVFAIGSNETTARLCGIRVDGTKIAIYALGGLFLGLAGVMQFARLSSGNPTSGQGMELKMIAAVVIGGGSLSGGRGSIFGTCCGAALMHTIESGCTALHLANPIQDILIGVIIVVAVCIDRIRAGQLSLSWLDWTWRWALRGDRGPEAA